MNKSKLNIKIIVADYYKEITNPLTKSCIKFLEKNNLKYEMKSLRTSNSKAPAIVAATLASVLVSKKSSKQDARKVLDQAGRKPRGAKPTERRLKSN